MKKILLVCGLTFLLIVAFGFFANSRINNMLEIYQNGEARAHNTMQIKIEEIRSGKSELSNDQIAGLLQIQLEYKPEHMLIDYLYKYLIIFLFISCLISTLLLFLDAYYKIKINKIPKQTNNN
ncbi:MAG: hypothetical protein JWM28_572 [Chitinophagaceae bacterium]|nr:hypothetical protein [Chitinophagaceae bacterium]